MAGWIKIHRELMNHWVSDEPEALAVWIRLLSEANFSDVVRNINGCLVTVFRGQLVFGIHKFSARSGVSVGKLRRIIKQLESDGSISKQNFQKYSIISIVKYDDYQANDKQTASRQQADNKQRTTLEEGENSIKGENPYNPIPEDSCESSVANCPHGDILDAWKEALPEKRQPRRNLWRSDRKEYKNLTARWREMANTQHSETGEPLYQTKEEGIQWWRGFFRNIRNSQFLMDDQPWFDLGWVVNKSNFYKIIENKYHEGAK